MEKRLIEKRLAWIESRLEQLRRLGRPDEIESDPVRSIRDRLAAV